MSDETVTAPGETVSLKITTPSAGQELGQTVSAAVPFETEKGLLADKPLRRPNRTKPRNSSEPKK